MSASIVDPYRSFKFSVTFEGGATYGFQKVGGLKDNSDVVPYREGTMAITHRKLPGLLNFEPLTLQRGTTNNMYLLEWRKQVAAAEIEGGQGGTATGRFDGLPFNEFRRNTAVIRLFSKGDDENAVKQWTAIRCWPSELAYSDLNAEASEVLIENCVIQHEGLAQTLNVAGSAGGSTGGRGSSSPVATTV